MWMEGENEYGADGGQGKARKVLLKMAVCMALGEEDISNAEEGRTTHCQQKVQAVVSMEAVFCQERKGRWWLVDLDSHEMALVSSE